MENINLIAACSVGSASAACCLALSTLDQMGCFTCSPAYDALMVYAGTSLSVLKDGLYTQCIPENSRFPSSQCPATQELSSLCSGGDYATASELRVARLDTTNQFANWIFSKHDHEGVFDNVTEMEQDLHNLITEEGAQIHWPAGGVFNGRDGIVEYIATSHPQLTGGMWKLGPPSFLFSFVFSENAIGYQARTENTSFLAEGSVGLGRNIGSAYTSMQEFHFPNCSALVLTVNVLMPQSFIDAAWALTKYGFNGTYICQLHEDYCRPLGSASWATQFENKSSCLNFYDTIPRKGCANPVHEINGLASGCKYRHALMLRSRPKIHCAHIGDGTNADNHSEFYCAPSDCTRTVSPPTLINPTFTAPYDNQTLIPEDSKIPVNVWEDQMRNGYFPLDDMTKLSLCNLEQIKGNGTSPLVVAFSALANSPCITYESVWDQPPGEATQAMLKELCLAQPNMNGSSMCAQIRNNLEFQLKRFENLCDPSESDVNGGVSRTISSSLESAGAQATLAAMRRMTSHHALTCMLPDESETRQWLCSSCGIEENLGNNVEDWAGGSSNLKGWWQGPLSRQCRSDLHHACSKRFEASVERDGGVFPQYTPPFCTVCFGASRSSVTGVCSSAITDWFDSMCTSSIAPRWWEKTLLEDAYNASVNEDSDEGKVNAYPGVDSANTMGYIGTAKNRFDFIVVGATTTGSVVARRLSAAGYDVLLLEEGIDFRADESLWTLTRTRRTVPGIEKTSLASRMSSMPNKAMFNQTMDIVGSNCLGGMSTFDAGAWTTSHESEFSGTDWPASWSDLSNYYTTAEAKVNPSMGDSQDLLNAWQTAVASTAADSVDAGIEDALEEPSTTFDSTGGRRDAFTAYVEEDTSIDVRSFAKVLRLIYDDTNSVGDTQKVTGVVYTAFGGLPLVAYARREVIVAAGHFDSPALLLRSGIGDFDKLKDVLVSTDGVSQTDSLRVHLPGVGLQLLSRPVFSMIYGGNVVSKEKNPHVYGTKSEMTRWKDGNASVWNVAPVAATGRVRSITNFSRISTIAEALSNSSEEGSYTFEFSSVDRFFSSALASTPLQTHFTHCLPCSVRSEGSVTISALGEPVIDLNLLEDTHDLATILACVKRMIKTNTEMDFRGMDLLGLESMSDTELVMQIRTMAKFSQSAYGSCRMGTGTNDVVDEKLLVHGVSNLRVVDASVIPSVPCAATSTATLYALAEKASALIVEDHAKRSVQDIGAHLFENAWIGRTIGWSIFATPLFVAVTLALSALLFGRGGRSVRNDTAAVEAASKPQSNLRNITRGRSIYGVEKRADLKEILGQKVLHEVRATSGVTILYEKLAWYHPVNTCFAKYDNFSPLIRNMGGHIEPGTVTFVMGPSGAGKTVLLRMLSQRHTGGTFTGSMTYSKRVATKSGFVNLTASGSDSVDFARSHIAMVPQLPDKYDEDMSTLEVAAMHNLLNHRLTWKESLPTVRRWIDFMQLDKVIDTPVARLSGGQIKRLQILTRLLSNPAALFADEPTSGLDTATAFRVMDILRTLAKRAGMTVVLSIHSPTPEILEMCDKLLVVCEGQCIYNGPYQDLPKRLDEVASWWRHGKVYNECDSETQAIEQTSSFLDRVIHRIKKATVSSPAAHKNPVNKYESYSSSRQISHIMTPPPGLGRIPEAPTRNGSSKNGGGEDEVGSLKEAPIDPLEWLLETAAVRTSRTKQVLLDAAMHRTESAIAKVHAKVRADKEGNSIVHEEQPRPLSETAAQGLHQVRVLFADFCCMLSGDFQLRHFASLANKFAMTLAMVACMCFVGYAFWDLLPPNEEADVRSLIGSFRIVLCTTVALSQLTVALSLVEVELHMLEIFAVEKIVDPISFSMYWFVRQSVIIATTLPSFLIFFTCLNFSPENRSDLCLLWVLFVGCCLSLVTLCQVLGRITLSPAYWGLFVVISSTYDGGIITYPQMPSVWQGYSKVNPIYQFMSVFISLEFGTEVTTSPTYFAFDLLNSVDYYNVRLSYSFTVLASWQVFAFVAIALWLSYKQRHSCVLFDGDGAQKEQSRGKKSSDFPMAMSLSVGDTAAKDEEGALSETAVSHPHHRTSLAFDAIETGANGL
eukprot:g2621.t1